MSFRLIATRPDGSIFQSDTTPLPDREATGMAALRVLRDAGIRFGRDGLAFGREVRDSISGDILIHAASGYRFRVEDF